MAYVTTIGMSQGQTDYRLSGHGCSTPERGAGRAGRANGGERSNDNGGRGGGDRGAATEPQGADARQEDRQFSYHVDGRERPLRWIGNGLREVGIEPGSELTPDQFDVARALMFGRDPVSGEQLVTPKRAVPEDAKVAVAPLLRTIEAMASEADVEPAAFVRGRGAAAAAEDASIATRGGHAEAASKVFRTAWAGRERRGEAARLRADEVGRLVDWLGLEPDRVWAPGQFARASANLFETVRTRDEQGVVAEQRVPRREVAGNAGYDLTFTLPKSYSLLLAFADEDTAARIERVFGDQVSRTFNWVEQTTSYAMAGHHGKGGAPEKQAQQLDTSGYLGWTMVHRAARPTGGREVGDPHWHVHLTVANMAKASDGKWRTIARGGRELMRHAPAMDHVLQALVRRELTTQFGVDFEFNQRTNKWEVAHVPDETLLRFSKRHTDIANVLEQLGYDDGAVSRAKQRIVEQETRSAKTEATAAADATLQQLWSDEERAAGGTPEQYVARALGRDTDRTTGQGSRSPKAGAAVATRGELVTQLAHGLQHPEHGATAHTRRFSRADAIAQIAAGLPSGAADVAEIETVTDSVLEQAGFRSLTRADEVDGPDGRRAQQAGGDMVNGQLYTTDDVVATELGVLRAARAASPTQSAHRVDHEAGALGIAVAEAQQGYSLSVEQTNTVLRLVTEGRAIDTVNGAPGTGKTTIMRAVRLTMEADGHTVAGAATAAAAAQHLQAETGIESSTVASLVHRLDHDQAPLEGVSLLVLDEANLTEDRDRVRLYRHAAETGTRVVEVGDRAQLRGVGIGSLFARIHNEVGGPELVNNQRQRDEDERATIAAWRDGNYTEALYSWRDRGFLDVRQDPTRTIAAMVARWDAERAGARDAHQSMRGLVMLAATNEATGRLNEAAQALRVEQGELAQPRDYACGGGGTLRLHVGEQVMVRANARNHAQGLDAGTQVLNGYRGIVTGFSASGGVHVAWRDEQQHEHTAVVNENRVAAGGLELGYAMTIHKAEGLTVKDQWDTGHGHTRGATVLFYADGADNPGMHVATTRHREQVITYASVEGLARPGEDAYLPRQADRLDYGARRLAEQARNTATQLDDVPVITQLYPGEFDTHRDAPEREPGGQAVPDPTATNRAQPDQASAAQDTRRAERDAAAVREQAWAADLLAQAWPQSHALVTELTGSKRFGRLATTMAGIEHDTGAAATIVGELDPTRIGDATVRDRLGYTTTVLTRAANRHTQRVEHAATMDQAADLLRDAWGDDALAERVIEDDAFPTVVSRLGNAYDAGLDPSELLARVPAEPIRAGRIGKPGAYLAWSLQQLTREHTQQTTPAAPISETTRNRLIAAAHAYTRPPEPATADEPQRAEPPRQHQAVLDRYAELNAAAAWFYRDQLDHSPATLSYLAGRVPDLAAARQRFTIGYAPAAWTALTDHLYERGFTERDLLDGGLAQRSSRGNLIDRFSDRVLFGIHDQHGRLAGFIGRPPHEHYDKTNTPKYRNTPHTPLFDKSALVFGLAEQHQELADGATPIHVEGPLDVLAIATHPDLADSGYAAVAGLGTAVTDTHLDTIDATATSPERIIALDGDQRGQEAAAKLAAKQLARSQQANNLVLPGGADPGEWFTERTQPASVLTTGEHTQPAAQFVASHAIETYFADHPPQHRNEIEGQLAAGRAAVRAVSTSDPATVAATSLWIGEQLDLDPTSLTDAVTSPAAASHSHAEAAPAAATQRATEVASPDRQTALARQQAHYQQRAQQLTRQAQHAEQAGQHAEAEALHGDATNYRSAAQRLTPLRAEPQHANANQARQEGARMHPHTNPEQRAESRSRATDYRGQLDTVQHAVEQHRATVAEHYQQHETVIGDDERDEQAERHDRYTAYDQQQRAEHEHERELDED